MEKPEAKTEVSPTVRAAFCQVSTARPWLLATSQEAVPKTWKRASFKKSHASETGCLRIRSFARLLVRIKVAYGAGFSEPSVLQVCAVIQVRLHWLPDSPVLFGGRRRFLRHHASHVLATGRKARQSRNESRCQLLQHLPRIYHARQLRSHILRRQSATPLRSPNGPSRSHQVRSPGVAALRQGRCIASCSPRDCIRVAVSPKRMIRREKVPSLPGILDSCKVRGGRQSPGCHGAARRRFSSTLSVSRSNSRRTRRRGLVARVMHVISAEIAPAQVAVVPIPILINSWKPLSQTSCWSSSIPHRVLDGLHDSRANDYGRRLHVHPSIPCAKFRN